MLGYGDRGESGLLLEVYRRLLEAFGPQGWWPAEDGFEMVVGAILTQSTAWVNVEKAIRNLRQAGALSAGALERLPEERVAELIRPSGYYRVKARKVKAFCQHLWEVHGGDLQSLFHVKLPDLREELLGIWGIGPETADSIVLYGAQQPIFVVDAYTRRICARLKLAPPDAGYQRLQRLFMDNLAPSVSLFQEYHALLVALGKGTCRPRPRCPGCPLAGLCPSALLPHQESGSSASRHAAITSSATAAPSQPRISVTVPSRVL